MLNYRRVDNKFYISGGWQDIERDTEWLKTENIRAVLDLQYTPYDSPNAPEFIKGYLADEGIDYHYILMYDGEWNDDLYGIFKEGENILTEWDNIFTLKKDRLLIKCAAGISRSVSQYLNYICKRDNLSYIQAYHEFGKREAKFALIENDINFWNGSPGPWFAHFLKEKYPMNGSAFGEIDNGLSRNYSIF